jgi:hypothetical protein
VEGDNVGIFGKKQPPKVEYPWDKRAPQIDADREYDVYCRYSLDTTIVYRSVKFKGQRSLPGEDHLAISRSYHLIEKKDGTQYYIAPNQIILFCEHGVNPGLEMRTIEEEAHRTSSS